MITFYGPVGRQYWQRTLQREVIPNRRFHLRIPDENRLSTTIMRTPFAFDEGTEGYRHRAMRHPAERSTSSLAELATVPVSLRQFRHLPVECAPQGRPISHGR